jgi:hypothetical protein
MGILGKDPTEGMSPRAYDDYMSQIKANNADRASDKRTHAITYRLDKQIELLTKILERLEMVYIIPLVSEDQEQTLTLSVCGKKPPNISGKRGVDAYKRKEK